MHPLPPARRRLHLVRRIAIALLVFAKWFLAPACAEEARSNPTPREVVVTIDNFSFNPADVTVKPGTTVIWENRDDIPHTVVETGTAFRSKPLDTGDRYSFTFASAGDFAYFCSLHPHMTGTVKVRAQPHGATASESGTEPTLP